MDYYEYDEKVLELAISDQKYLKRVKMRLRSHPSVCEIRKFFAHSAKAGYISTFRYMVEHFRDRASEVLIPALQGGHKEVIDYFMGMRLMREFSMREYSWRTLQFHKSFRVVSMVRDIPLLRKILAEVRIGNFSSYSWFADNLMRLHIKQKANAMASIMLEYTQPGLYHFTAAVISGNRDMLAMLVSRIRELGWDMHSYVDGYLADLALSTGNLDIYDMLVSLCPSLQTEFSTASRKSFCLRGNPRVLRYACEKIPQLREILISNLFANPENIAKAMSRSRNRREMYDYLLSLGIPKKIIHCRGVLHEMLRGKDLEMFDEIANATNTELADWESCMKRAIMHDYLEGFQHLRSICNCMGSETALDNNYLLRIAMAEEATQCVEYLVECGGTATWDRFPDVLAELRVSGILALMQKGKGMEKCHIHSESFEIVCWSIHMFQRKSLQEQRMLYRAILDKVTLDPAVYLLENQDFVDKLGFQSVPCRGFIVPYMEKYGTRISKPLLRNIAHFFKEEAAHIIRRLIPHMTPSDVQYMVDMCIYSRNWCVLWHMLAAGVKISRFSVANLVYPEYGPLPGVTNIVSRLLQHGGRPTADIPPPEMASSSYTPAIHQEFRRQFFQEFSMEMWASHVLRRNMTRLVKEYIYAPCSRHTTEDLELMCTIGEDYTQADAISLRRTRNKLIRSALKMKTLPPLPMQVPMPDGSGKRWLNHTETQTLGLRQHLCRLPTSILQDLTASAGTGSRP